MNSNLLFNKGFLITPTIFKCNSPCNINLGSKSPCICGLKSLTILYIIFVYLISIYFIQLHPYWGFSSSCKSLVWLSLMTKKLRPKFKKLKPTWIVFKRLEPMSKKPMPKRPKTLDLMYNKFGILLKKPILAFLWSKMPKPLWHIFKKLGTSKKHILTHSWSKKPKPMPKRLGSLWGIF